MKNKTLAMTAAFFCAILVSCKPVRVDPLVEIRPNETAFVIPLEAGTEEQERLESIQFLRERQVAAKRIVIPQRERRVGRFYWQLEWIPTVRVISVDRTPVTRNWIQDAREDKRADNSTRTFGVESRDSIGFSVGVNISAYIEEENAAKYLYYYRGNDLADVMDKNVRERVHTVLSQEFAKLTLSESKSKKVEITEKLNNDVREHFEKYGITITSIGLAEGLFFEQEEIQKAINDAYVAEMSVERAKQKVKEQEEINNQKILEAQGQQRQAEIFAKTAEDRKKLVEIEVDMIRAEAFREAVKKWDGTLPKMVTGDASSLLFQVDP